MKVHTSGEVQRFFATANTDPMSMAQPWGDAFEPEYFPLVSTGVGSEEDGVFGAIYVELVLNVAVAKSGNVAKNCLLGGFGNIYITATFDCTFNSNSRRTLPTLRRASGTRFPAASRACQSHPSSTH